MPPDRFGLVVLATGAMIDGLWLRRSAGESLTCDAAVALVMAVVTALISPAERSLLQNG